MNSPGKANVCVYPSVEKLDRLTVQRPGTFPVVKKKATRITARDKRCRDDIVSISLGDEMHGNWTTLTRDRPLCLFVKRWYAQRNNGQHR